METNEREPRTNPEQWVDRHGDYLYRFALMRLRNTQLAEEVVQETFLAAFRGRDRFEGNSTERTWLTGILRHKIIDYFRRSSREVALDSMDDFHEEQNGLFETSGEWVGHWKSNRSPSDWGTKPDAVLEKKEFWRILQQSLSKLPERLANVFVLREVEGLESGEICRLMNISESNLWVMLHRARGQLRKSLEDYYQSGHKRSFGGVTVSVGTPEVSRT